MPSENNNKRCILLGECMLEVSPDASQRYDLRYAGDSFNVAWYMAQYRKQHHIDVAYITALGEDNLSQRLLEQWLADGIDTKHIIRIAAKLPGLYVIELNKDGERSFYYYRDQSAAKHLFDKSAAEITSAVMQADYFYCSAISLAIFDRDQQVKLLDVMQQAKQSGVITVFDSNYRASLWQDTQHAQDIIRQAWQHTCMALPSWQDEKNIFDYQSKEDCIKQLLQWGVTDIAMSCAQEPVILATQQSQQEIPITPITNIIDTTAAGDSFNAGYMMARILDEKPAKAVQYGINLASKVIQHHGALIDNEHMPSWQELQHD